MPNLACLPKAESILKNIIAFFSVDEQEVEACLCNSSLQDLIRHQAQLMPTRSSNRKTSITPVYSVYYAISNPFRLPDTREKFDSLHFPETENGRGFDSRLNTRQCVLQLMSELFNLCSFDSIFLLKLIDPVVVAARFINRAGKLLNGNSPNSIGIFCWYRFHEEGPQARLFSAG